jgi:hypothetical protein
MHRHECNTLNHLFNFRKSGKPFSYTIFRVSKINVEKFFKVMRKLLFNYSFYYILKLGNFRV